MRNSRTAVATDPIINLEQRHSKFNVGKSFEIILFLLFTNMSLTLLMNFPRGSREEDVTRETLQEILTILKNRSVEGPGSSPSTACPVPEPLECPPAPLAVPPVTETVPEKFIDVQAHTQAKTVTARVEFYFERNFKGVPDVVTLEDKLRCYDLPRDLDKVMGSLEVTGKCVLFYTGKGCVKVNAVRMECNSKVADLKEFDKGISSMAVATPLETLYWKTHGEVLSQSIILITLPN